jgi:hypothetical protein
VFACRLSGLVGTDLLVQDFEDGLLGSIADRNVVLCCGRREAIRQCCMYAQFSLYVVPLAVALVYVTPLDFGN